MTSEKSLSRLEITVVAEDSVGYETPFLGQHGISFFITAARGDMVKNILVDVAQHPDALLENMARMGIDPAAVDAIVLTHCHYDHTQGLASVIRATGRKDLPIIAHPDIFRPNFITDPGLRHVGVMDGDRREDIAAAGGSLFLCADPLEIMPGLSTTGEVERTTDFEAVGMDLFTLEDGRLKTDPMLDDISLIANMGAKGLVVVTGCSHAGIVNITRQAGRLTGTENIHCIIGGFHLVEAPEDRIVKTAQALSTFDPDIVWAGHCTGFRAQVELFNTFGDRFSPLQTGMKLTVAP